MKYGPTGSIDASSHVSSARSTSAPPVNAAASAAAIFAGAWRAALALTMAALVVTAHGKTPGVELAGDVVITLGMFTQSMHDDDDAADLQPGQGDGHGDAVVGEGGDARGQVRHVQRRVSKGKKRQQRQRGRRNGDQAVVHVRRRALRQPRDDARQDEAHEHRGGDTG